MKVNRCDVEVLAGESAFEGKPMSPNEGAEPTQVGRLVRFRITTTDTLNHVFGLITWPAARPEVRSIERISGLDKYAQLEKNGRLSLVPVSADRWLAEVNAIKFNPQKGFGNLATISDEDLEDLLDCEPEAFFKSVGCLAYGTRSELLREEGKRKTRKAILVKAGDVESVAAMFAATRVMAIMFDRGA